MSDGGQSKKGRKLENANNFGLGWVGHYVLPAKTLSAQFFNRDITAVARILSCTLQGTNSCVNVKFYGKNEKTENK